MATNYKPTVELNLKLLASHHKYLENFSNYLFEKLCQIIQKVKVQPTIYVYDDKLYWEYLINDKELKFIFSKDTDKMEVYLNNEKKATLTITTENINNFYMDVLLQIEK